MYLEENVLHAGSAWSLDNAGEETTLGRKAEKVCSVFVNNRCGVILDK